MKISRMKPNHIVSCEFYDILDIKLVQVSFAITKIEKTEEYINGEDNVMTRAVELYERRNLLKELINLSRKIKK